MPWIALLTLSVGIEFIWARVTSVKSQQVTDSVSDIRTQRSDPNFTWIPEKQNNSKLVSGVVCPSWAQREGAKVGEEGRGRGERLDVDALKSRLQVRSLLRSWWHEVKATFKYSQNLLIFPRLCKLEETKEPNFYSIEAPSGKTDDASTFCKSQRITPTVPITVNHITI